MAAGGYECEFVDSVSKDFECQICLHVTREPHLTSCCGQDFCQNCINRVLTDNKPCPLCKARPFSVMLNKKERRRVLELKVYCSMKDRGCGWIGELGELNSHLDTRNGKCQYVDVPCTNNCGETLQRQLLHKHLSRICPKRDFSCKYCSYKATYEDVHDKHWPVCTKHPLPCPNNCGIGTVERGSLEKHLSECPLQLVQCEFSHLGCSEKIRRKDVPKHMEENTQKHLVVVSATLRQVMDMNTQLETKLAEKDKETQRRLAEKDEQLDRLQTELETKLAEMDEWNLIQMEQIHKELAEIHMRSAEFHRQLAENHHRRSAENGEKLMEKRQSERIKERKTGLLGRIFKGSL